MNYLPTDKSAASSQSGTHETPRDHKIKDKITPSDPIDIIDLYIEKSLKDTLKFVVDMAK